MNKKLLSTIFLFSLALFLPTKVFAFSNSHNRNAPITDGTVYTISQNGNYVYIGGDFTYAGPDTGPIAIFDTGTNTLESPTYNDYTGFAVDDAASDGSGGYYVVGNFTKMQSVLKSYALHILSDGTIDTGWTASPALTTRAYAVEYDVSSNRVFIYSDITVKGYDGTTGAYDNTWNISTDNIVYDMEISSGYLYLGGPFTQVASTTRNGLAAINISTKTLDAAWNPNVSGTLQSISIANSKIYSVGSFNTVNTNVTRNNAAAFNLAGSGRTGTDQNWNPDLSTTTYAVKATANNVYIGGDFLTVNGGTSVPYLAKVNTTNGTYVSAFNAELNSSVFCVDVNGDESKVYIGGQFTTIAGASHTNFAELDSTNGDRTSWKISADSANPVQIVKVTGTKLFVSGPKSIGGYVRSGAARLSTEGVLDSWDPGLNSYATVYAFEFDTNNVYIGGDFSSVNNGASTRRNIAALLKTDATVVSGFNPDPDDAVKSIKKVSTNLYIGGDFLTLESSSKNRGKGAKIDLSDYSVTSWNPNITIGNINTIVTDNTNVYIGGNFTDVDGNSRGNAAAFNITTGNDIGWNPDFNDWVEQMDIDNSNHKLYIGGDFSSVNGGSASRGYVAQYDITTPATPTLTSWDPQADDYVYAVKYNSSTSTVLLGGDFYNLGSDERINVGEVAVSNAAATSWDPSADCTIYGINTYNTTSYIGGCFSQLGSYSLSNIGFAMFGDGSAPAQPNIQFSATSSSGSESTTSVNLTLQLSASTGSDVTVDYDITGGSATENTDFTISGTSATITAGNTSTTIPITITNDTGDESDETVEITISNPTNATLGTNTVYTYTITDNDDPAGEDSNNGNSAPNKPKNFEIVGYTIGEYVGTNTPEFKFKVTDEDNDKVGYKMQISTDKKFEKLVLDYGKENKSTNTFSFIVGQSGDYSIGKEKMKLKDDDYYVRIKSIDEHGAKSSYYTVNDGKAAFTVSTKKAEISNLETEIKGSTVIVSYSVNKDSIASIKWGYDNLDNKKMIDIYSKEHSIEMLGINLNKTLKIEITIKDKAGIKVIKNYKLENKKLTNL